MKSLTINFLYELYGTAIENEMVAALVSTHMDRSYLPNRHFQKIHSAFSELWTQYKEPPSFGVLSQRLAGEDRCLEILNECVKCVSHNIESTLESLEGYIRGVKIKNTIAQSAKEFDAGNVEKSESIVQEFADWQKEFSLKPTDMVDILDTFESRYNQNKKNMEDERANTKPVYRFYIDKLDQLNGQRNLRGQLTAVLASSGVGKSHFARHVGLSACIQDGLDVLHIQLEGTKKEVTDAYSASLAGYNAMYYEQAMIPDEEFKQTLKHIKSISGNLLVKSYTKFGSDVSTWDIRRMADEFLDNVGKYPDIIIVDSMDLLTDSGKTKRVQKELRHIMINVAQDLKNIAMDLGCWVVTTYQATIEDGDWLNDEKNHLTRAHLSESKGIVRPLTHLITLNQTDAEKDENRMRLYIDKSRFFKGDVGGIIKIKTDYDNGSFYDSAGTLRFAQ